MECISYKKGYKYQLAEDYFSDIGIRPGQPIDTDYIVLTMEGSITIKTGYAWDGPSGPAIDTLNFMRGSLVHDALYQLMQEGHLDGDDYQEPADRLLQTMCREDGMSRIRAWWVYKSVHWFGGPATEPSNQKPVIQAPEPC